MCVSVCVCLGAFLPSFEATFPLELFPAEEQSTPNCTVARLSLLFAEMYSIFANCATEWKTLKFFHCFSVKLTAAMIDVSIII